MQLRRKKRIESPPDITPMIDVVFLLLIFFMISTTFINTPGIKITLPEATSDEIKTEKTTIRLVISNKGDIYMDDEKLALEALGNIFTSAAKEAKESIVIISADENASHGSVVKVMDSAKNSGITRLAIETQAK
ncbi:MAG: biopolymer transporter ExbD [bacterium]|nr:biopolymer transporter ExbD [bacterium]